MKTSSEDEAALVYPLPDGIFGWIAQQAVEKLYKALLSAHGRAYPFTHDLLLLRSMVDAQGEKLLAFAFPLQDLSEYAGQFR